jgi:hypothetical protein
MHIALLIREADPHADAEVLTDFLLAPLSADTYLYLCRDRELDPARLVEAYERLVDRLLG